MNIATELCLVAGILGGWEIVLILAVVLVLIGAKRLPDLAQGMREGVSQFRKASTGVAGEIGRATDEMGHEAGESLGGIYGKPAAQALTPNNLTAELYEAAVFGERQKRYRPSRLRRWHRWVGWCRRTWRQLRRRLNRI